MNPSDFYTRDKANEGEKFFLPLPDGTLTEHYLIVRHIDSDSFRDTKSRIMRNAALSSKPVTDAEKAERAKSIHLDLLVAMIAGWSFETEFNEAVIREFLINCPSIADKIDGFGSDKANFFKLAPNS